MIIDAADNVEIKLEDGHKYARCDIKAGQEIIKYANPIGVATADIKAGEHIHTHNMKTALEGKKDYSYAPVFFNIPKREPKIFMGYRRKNGDVGIRNEIWIVGTVGCVNKIGTRLAAITGAQYFAHPYGCSQLGDDHKTTQLILRGLVNHPNAGGVLVLGLGCENNNITEFKKVLGDYDEQRVKFLNAQDCEDEIKTGCEIIDELKVYAAQFERTEIPVSELKIGLKCGGSDGLSGITANPLVGALSDKLISMGATTVLTEVPEMFGAEHLLMRRCESKGIFDKTVKLINDFKDYFVSHNQVVYENPSPGNKAGGITTLEEKSLGCIQKGGKAKVVDVLTYGDTLKKNGLNLLNGPGNDIVAVTNLTAVGAHIILFTTGRGTPVGAPVPTVKVATNKNLAARKTRWIDFDASPLLSGVTMDELSEKFLDYIIEVASGTQTRNEKNDCREIAIFKDGVTL